MARTPFGLTAEKNGRRIVRRFATQQETNEAIAEFEATGWDVEESAPIEEPWSERRRREAVEREYQLDAARSQVRMGDVL